MKPEITTGNHASYIQINEITENTKPVKTKDIGGGVYVDYRADGGLIGIEIVSEVKVKYYGDYKENK